MTTPTPADRLAEARCIWTDRVGYIDVGGGAQMLIPCPAWDWELRYKRKEPDRGGMCDDRMLAAGVNESYLYLIEECTKEESWRRIKIMRAALARAGVRKAGGG